MTNITLDFAIEAFEYRPNVKTANALLETAQEYFDDEMIGPESFTAAVAPAQAWLALQ